jgi:hypothetical protein
VYYSNSNQDYLSFSIVPLLMNSLLKQATIILLLYVFLCSSCRSHPGCTFNWNSIRIHSLLNSSRIICIIHTVVCPYRLFINLLSSNIAMNYNCAYFLIICQLMSLFMKLDPAHFGFRCLHRIECWIYS